jgi:hypothetical protein
MCWWGAGGEGGRGATHVFNTQPPWRQPLAAASITPTSCKWETCNIACITGGRQSFSSSVGHELSFVGRLWPSSATPHVVQPHGPTCALSGAWCCGSMGGTWGCISMGGTWGCGSRGGWGCAKRLSSRAQVSGATVTRAPSSITRLLTSRQSSIVPVHKGGAPLPRARGPGCKPGTSRL